MLRADTVVVDVAGVGVGVEIGVVVLPHCIGGGSVLIGAFFRSSSEGGYSAKYKGPWSTRISSPLSVTAWTMRLVHIHERSHNVSGSRATHTKLSQCRYINGLFPIKRKDSKLNAVMVSFIG